MDFYGWKLCWKWKKDVREIVKKEWLNLEIDWILGSGSVEKGDVGMFLRLLIWVIE